MSSPSRTLKVVLGYNGAEFHGFQSQKPPEVRTVEDELRAAAQPLSVGGVVATSGASRTDTGVHALGQCVRLTLDSEREAAEIERALAGRTAADIQIRGVADVLASFDPCRDAIAKKYVYRLLVGEPRPLFSDRTAWWIDRELNLDSMQGAAGVLLGRHDFSTFQNVSKDPPESAVRTIHSLDCVEVDGGVEVRVVGDGFLYKMVRNLTGTLVDVGRGRFGPEDVRSMLAEQNRTAGGPTAPPQGLFLVSIQYPGDPELRTAGPALTVR